MGGPPLLVGFSVLRDEGDLGGSVRGAYFPAGVPHFVISEAESGALFLKDSGAGNAIPAQRNFKEQKSGNAGGQGGISAPGLE